MNANRLELVGLSVLVLTLTTTVSLAQNTSNPLLSGNTVNPVLSGNTVAPGREAPVSPATPSLNLSTGTNPFTGLPCAGPPTTGGTTTAAGAAFRAFTDLCKVHVDVMGPHKRPPLLFDNPRSREAAGGHVGSGCPLHRYDAQSGVKVNVDV
jgi:hypothetical protein